MANPEQKILLAVIDTNHIMSAILSSKGASAKLIDWLTEEEDYYRLLMSQPIWDEYQTVADWLIPESRQDEKNRILNTLRLESEWITPNTRIDVCSDKSDNRFLEYAIEGNANYLVTKNIRHFPPKEYQGVKIIRVRKFLKVLEKAEQSRQQQ